MYKGDDDDGAGVSEADGGDGGGSPLKIRLNINELSLPTAHHLRLGIHAFLRRWLRVSATKLCVGVKLMRPRNGSLWRVLRGDSENTCELGFHHHRVPIIDRKLNFSSIECLASSITQ